MHLFSTLPPLLRHPGVSPFRRNLFSLPDLSAWGSETQKYREQKQFPYNQNQLYDIVADVCSYPRFVPFCVGSRILRNSIQPQTNGLPLVMEAELTVNFLAFRESYVSKVTCTPFESVEAVATSSTPLFNTLSTIWRFQPAFTRTVSSDVLQSSSPHGSALAADLSKGPTLVTFDLAFAFANPIYATVSAGFFGQVSKLMVKAFEERCLEVYGPACK